MIQRIQTVYLFLAAVALGLLFVFPLATDLSGNPALSAGSDKVVMAIALSTMALALGTIFLFKNRPLQLRLCDIGALASLAAGIYAGVFIVKSESATIGLGIALPLIASNLFYFARRGVKKDENLVKSMDRIR